MLRARALLSALACATLACVSSVPVQPGDGQLVVRLADLGEFTELPPGAPAEEKLARTQGPGGIVEIDYAFDPDDESIGLIVYSGYGFYPSRGNAKAAFTAFNVGAGIGGDVEAHDELFQYGDHTRFGFILNDDGERVGTYYNMARGRSALRVVIGGLVFDDPELWRALIEPRLRAIEAFERRQLASPP